MNDRVEMGAFKMPDGSVYKGQWTRDLRMRDGKGMQIWQDGSIYEG